MQKLSPQKLHWISLFFSVSVAISMLLPGSVVVIDRNYDITAYCSYLNIASWNIFFGWNVFFLVLPPIVVCVWGLVEKKPIMLQLCICYIIASVYDFYFILRRENTFALAIENRCYLPFLPFLLMAGSLTSAFLSRHIEKTIK